MSFFTRDDQFPHPAFPSSDSQSDVVLAHNVQVRQQHIIKQTEMDAKNQRKIFELRCANQENYRQRVARELAARSLNKSLAPQNDDDETGR